MKSSISKSKRSKDLKNTHTIPDIEKLMEEKLGIILNGSTLKDKKEAKKQLRLLERHFNDVSAKKENGNKYPEQRIYHSDNKPMNNEEIMKLIDSVQTPHDTKYNCYTQPYVKDATTGKEFDLRWK